MRGGFNSPRLHQKEKPLNWGFFFCFGAILGLFPCVGFSQITIIFSFLKLFFKMIFSRIFSRKCVIKKAVDQIIIIRTA